jgi:hypothetical protein
MSLKNSNDTIGNRTRENFGKCVSLLSSLNCLDRLCGLPRLCITCSGDSFSSSKRPERETGHSPRMAWSCVSAHAYAFLKCKGICLHCQATSLYPSNGTTVTGLSSLSNFMQCNAASNCTKAYAWAICSSW